MAKVFSDGKRILLENVVLAFPHLVTPPPEGKFSCALIFDKNSSEAKVLDEVAKQVAKEGFGDKADKVIKGMAKSGRYPVKDGDDKDEYDGYAGKAYTNAYSQVKPSAFHRNREEMTDSERQEYLYSGAVVNAVVSLYKYSNKNGDGVGVGLMGIQFVKEGERLAGGGKAKADDFDDLPVQEEGDDDLPPY